MLSWFESNLLVWTGNPFLACYQKKEQTDIFYIASGSTYLAYPYFFNPNYPGAYPLTWTCRYLCQRCQVWRQLWIHSIIPIIPGWVHQLLSPIRHSYDITPPLIWCVPGGWGFHRIRGKKGRLIERGIEVCYALCCDVRLRGILCCI